MVNSVETRTDQTHIISDCYLSLGNSLSSFFSVFLCNSQTIELYVLLFSNRKSKLLFNVKILDSYFHWSSENGIEVKMPLLCMPCIFELQNTNKIPFLNSLHINAKVDTVVSTEHRQWHHHLIRAWYFRNLIKFTAHKKTIKMTSYFHQLSLLITILLSCEKWEFLNGLPTITCEHCHIRCIQHYYESICVLIRQTKKK